MIKRYALRKNVMLLLTTHRLDLAEKLATKRYHINENGVMEQMEIKSKEKEYNFWFGTVPFPKRNRPKSKIVLEKSENLI